MGGRTANKTLQDNTELECNQYTHDLRLGAKLAFLKRTGTSSPYQGQAWDEWWNKLDE